VEKDKRFLTLLQNALESIQDPRFFETERGFQGELLVQLGKRLKQAEFPGDPLVEQEYQKTIPSHGINIRPDIIIHVPFGRGQAKRRDEGNFVAMELKLRSTENDARHDFASLEQMHAALRYPLTVFINIDSDKTHSMLCPRSIASQTACIAVRLEDGKSVVRLQEP
jgi:hypothetical protein